jgi:hypothetical protein
MINSNILAVNVTNIIRGIQLFKKTIEKSPQNPRRQKGNQWRKFHIEKPQLLGPAVQNLDARVNGSPGFVHPCYYLILINPHF